MDTAFSSRLNGVDEWLGSHYESGFGNFSQREQIPGVESRHDTNWGFSVQKREKLAVQHVTQKQEHS
jgi:hypothetical protein